jgi:pyruvate kinase
MAKIANQMEKTEIEQHEAIEESLKKLGGITETVSFAVKSIADDLKAKLIVCATTGGFTARSIVKYKPNIPVVALAATEKTKHQLCLSWGVDSYYLPFVPSFNQLISKIKKLLVSKKLVAKGDIIVITAGHPFGYLGQTNLIKVETI